jgi:protein-S-isoprenylcysteine O-methyltransferase Ste14
VGAVLAALGLVVLLTSGLRVLKAFREQRLLTASGVVYALFRALVPAEDRWLKEKFGAQYDEYRRRVLVRFL